LIPAEGASQVFISLVTSVGMMMLFSNCNPYMHWSDDILAQFCQLSLTLALSIGLLEKASDSFQDAFFGPLLVVGTTTNLALGVIVIVSDFLATAMPETLEATTKRMTHLTSKEGNKKKKNRKTVVAPFLGHAISDSDGLGPQLAIQGPRSSAIQEVASHEEEKSSSQDLTHPRSFQQDVVQQFPPTTAIPKLDIERVAVAVPDSSPECAPKIKRKSKAKKLPGLLSSVRSSREKDPVDQSDLF